MQVKVGENKVAAYTSGTFDGIFLHANLFAASANNALVVGDFLAQYVTVQVDICKDGIMKSFTNNLQLYGIHNARRSNTELNTFVYGFNLSTAASGVYAQKIRSVKIRFTEPLTLNSTKGDYCNITITFAPNAISSNVNSATSFLDFYLSPSDSKRIGFGIPFIDVTTIQVNTTNQTINLGNNVSNVTFLNLDQTNYATQVFTQVGLTSDTVNKQLQFYEAIAEEQFTYLSTSPLGLNTAANALTSNIYTCPPLYPQSLTIHHKFKAQLDLLQNASLYMAFNSANVNASQNFVIADSIIITPSTANAAYKHALNQANAVSANLINSGARRS